MIKGISLPGSPEDCKTCYVKCKTGLKNINVI